MNGITEKKTIYTRDNLSFTARDGAGRLVYWIAPPEKKNWHECYAMGQGWFDEIRELAMHDPHEAHQALISMGMESLSRSDRAGYEAGFFERMSYWAIAGIQQMPSTEDPGATR